MTLTYLSEWEKGALKDTLNLAFEQFQCCIYTLTQTYQLSPCYSMSPMKWRNCCLMFFPSLSLRPHTHTPLSSRVSLPFSPQSNYLASEGGNLLSLVAAQVPIRANELHLSNELITLNELKTLCRRSCLWKKKRAAGRDEGDLGDKNGNAGLCRNTGESSEWLVRVRTRTRTASVSSAVVHVDLS